mmetsp:Transcript_26220/g.30318  ORF Transcript_26220/g.30318 Transcript_26220/m.30318 type:complete len:161 (-) Transcript_26220:73-555(-)
MPRGAGKGGKTRKKTKNMNDAMRRPLTLKEDGQEYALVSKMLGSSRVECMCADLKKRICLIRGTMKNRVWIKQGDLVLISIRDFEADKGDIILKYTIDEYKDLKKKGEIPETLKVEETGKDESDEDVEFQEVTNHSKVKLIPDSDDEEEKKEEIDIDTMV